VQLESDDGSRLWLDGKLLIDCWRGPGRHAVKVELGDRPHALRVEYFQVDSVARVRLSWAQEESFPMQPVPTRCLFHDRTVAQKGVVP
jgi:hypothetical protein